MNLKNKSLEEIKKLTREHTRDEMCGLLHRAYSVEPMYKPAEIALLCRRPRTAVLEAIRSGKMGDYFVFGENSLAVPASGVQQWLREFRIVPRRV